MQSFDPELLENLRLPHRLTGIIRQIGHYQGRQDLYKEKAPETLANLQRVAAIESVEASNRIENITVGPKTIQAIVQGNQMPAAENRPQGEIAGYRDVLNQIHQSHAHIPLTPSVVLQFHRDLLKYISAGGGQWKASQNQIAEKFADGTIKRIRFTPVEPYRVAETMALLHERLDFRLKQQEIDALVLIPLYVLDFLCIHPFSDGNGRLSRLLTTLLLYHQGYEVCRYISLERLVEHTKDSYYDTLLHASQGWHDAKHDPAPFIEYLLGVILAAYRELEARVETVQEIPGVKTNMVITAIRQLKGSFTFGELARACPLVSENMIRIVLNELKENGKIENSGRGRGSRWHRVNSTNRK